jgi:hypothetical protein
VQTPFRIEPELGKITEDKRETSPNKLGDVFQEHETWSHITNDSFDGRPNPAVVLNSQLFACLTERLAWEPCSDAIHFSTPSLAIKGCEIVPDRSFIQGLLTHPGHESGRCVGVPLNVSHGSGIDASKFESEFKSTVSATEVDAVELGMCSHISLPNLVVVPCGL